MRQLLSIPLGRLRTLRSASQIAATSDELPRKASNLWERATDFGQRDFPTHHYDDETAAQAALHVVGRHTMGSYERMVTLWQQVRYVDRASIPGALVECGTWRAGASGMMALAHKASGAPTRNLHLFDSFEGLPEPSAEHDGDRAIDYAKGRAGGALTSIEACVAPLDDARSLIRDRVGYPALLTHFHVGWFQNTVPIAAPTIGPIALLRLDGDWYESTKICLEQLYTSVSSGGVVVIDDYGCWTGCRKATDEFLARLARLPLLCHVDAAGRYFVKP